MLGGVVEHAGLVGLVVGFLDNVFEVGVRELTLFGQIVQVRDICLMVLAVMEFQGLLGHIRSERVDRIGQIGQSVSHRNSPFRKLQVVALKLWEAETVPHLLLKAGADPCRDRVAMKTSLIATIWCANSTRTVYCWPN